jgi:outer membrane protein assembly factor BamB/predicted phosphodiesterase
MTAFLLVPLLGLLFQGAPLRFAWLSDTHVGSDSGAQDLAAAVGELNTRHDLDFVFLSGDITEMGSTPELTTARAILDSLRHPLYIIPGNHDTKWSESGLTAYPRLFGPERFLFFKGGYAFLGIHQGPRMRMADGHFSPEDLRWADSALTRVREAGLPLIVVSHYPLDSGICNWYALLDRLKKVDTRFILTGHGHRNRIDSCEGIPALMGRSLLRASDATGGYNLVEISNDSITVTGMRIGNPTGHRWFEGRLAVPSRLADTQIPLRPDFAVNARYPQVKPVWKRKTGFTIAAPAAVSDGMAVVADVSGTVCGFRLPDGLGVWTFKAGGAVYGAPFASGDRVAFTTADSSVIALNVETGKLLWRIQTGAPNVAAPIICDSTVFVGGSDGTFRALDARTGSIKWAFDSLGGFVESRPAVSGQTVLFGAWDEHLYALARETGRMRWTWKGEHSGRLYSPAACWPVVAHGRAFIVAPDRMMTAFDLNTGKVVWRSGKHQVRESIGVSNDGERVYVRTLRDSLLALDSRSPEPRVVWAANLGFGYDINAAMPVEQDGIVYYGTMNGVISAVQDKDGSLLWQHRVSAVPVNTITPVAARLLLATTFDGEVVLLSWTEE